MIAAETDDGNLVGVPAERAAAYELDSVTEGHFPADARGNPVRRSRQNIYRGRWVARLAAAGLHPARDAPEISDELLVIARAAGGIGAPKDGRWVNGDGYERRQRGCHLLAAILRHANGWPEQRARRGRAERDKRRPGSTASISISGSQDGNRYDFLVVGALVQAALALRPLI